MDQNTLYYGDNLDILRRYVADDSVDLIYLDPPFNSNADYNVLFAEKDGTQAHAQINAFKDTWTWDREASAEFNEVLQSGHGRVAKCLKCLHDFLGGSDMMAYLSMMAIRLVELRRVLKPIGSIYLHCDPTASHYLKLVMDAVFGQENFSNEIIWRRTTTKNDYKQGAVNWPRVHDVVLMYHRSKVDARAAGRFCQPFDPYNEHHIETFYNFADPDGRRYRLSDLSAPGQGSRGHKQCEFLGVVRYWRYSKAKLERLYKEGKVEFRPHGKVPRLKVYLDEAPGVAIGDIWTDIRGMINLSKEMLGYPTQKPLALLERIITASSKVGDVVLDPFCGCGTAVIAAQKLKRRWIGIDITHLAVNLIKVRLADSFGRKITESYQVVGEPRDLESSRALAAANKYQFQYWALGLVGARPMEQKKGADKGIDGRLYMTDATGETRSIIISIKGGHVTASQVRDLRGVVEREDAAIGVFITLEEPTGPMKAEAAEAGQFQTKSVAGTRHPRLQILTIEDLLAGKKIDMPVAQDIRSFKQAPKATKAKKPSVQLPFEDNQPGTTEAADEEI